MKVSLCMCSSAENHPINHPAHHLPCTFILSYFHVSTAPLTMYFHMYQLSFMNVKCIKLLPGCGWCILPIGAC